MNAHGWLEVGDRVLTRRYAFLDQQIGAILTDDGPVVVDTRTTLRQAREIVNDLRLVTRLPVAAVINTHHHFDHTFGNAEFRSTPIWGEARTARRIRDHGDDEWVATHGWHPELADELAEVELVAPSHTFSDATTIEIGGRAIGLQHLGRGHTDNDTVVVLRDASVVFAGDLLITAGAPFFGDSFPAEWPVTLGRVASIGCDVVVPGHGPIADAAELPDACSRLSEIAALARRHLDGEGIDVLRRALPYPPEAAAEAIADAARRMSVGVAVGGAI